MSALACTECNRLPAPGKSHKKCSGCSEAVYCSERCQKFGWPIHRMYCKQYTMLHANPRPSPEHKLAFLLPVDTKDPQLFWMHCPIKLASDGTEECENPDYVVCLGGDRPFPLRIDVTGSMCSANPAYPRFKIKRTVRLFIRGSSEVDGSGMNMCVRAMMKDRQKHLWKGNMLVMSQPESKNENDPETYIDACSADIRILGDYFATGGRGFLEPLGLDAITPEKPLGFMHPEMVPITDFKGVIVHCWGDIHLSGKSLFSKTVVKSDHPIFKDTHPAGWTPVMEFPILARKMNDFNPAWRYIKDARGIGYLKNEHAARLGVRLYASEESETEPNEISFLNIGNVLVVRNDQKPLIPEHFEALIAFNFAHWKNGNTPRLRKIESMRVLEREASSVWNRNAFDKFFAGFKKFKLLCGVDGWKDVVSPYEI